jgi:hypothetical protein
VPLVVGRNKQSKVDTTGHLLFQLARQLVEYCQYCIGIQTVQGSSKFSLLEICQSTSRPYWILWWLDDCIQFGRRGGIVDQEEARRFGVPLHLFDHWAVLCPWMCHVWSNSTLLYASLKKVSNDDWMVGCFPSKGREMGDTVCFIFDELFSFSVISYIKLPDKKVVLRVMFINIQI